MDVSFCVFSIFLLLTVHVYAEEYCYNESKYSAPLVKYTEQKQKDIILDV